MKARCLAQCIKRGLGEESCSANLEHNEKRNRINLYPTAKDLKEINPSVVGVMGLLKFS